MAARPRLKICGVATVPDARLVSEAGADYCGILVDVSFSERSCTLENAREVAAASTVPVVILLCEPGRERAREIAEALRPHALQLLCRETPQFLAALKPEVACRIWKTIHLPVLEGQASPREYIDAGADALLVDSVDTGEGFERMGGTGKTADWNAAKAVVDTAGVPVFLAGGIGPDNVAQALREVSPAGIDLCSGVERSKGTKDPEKVWRLMRNFTATADRIERGHS